MLYSQVAELAMQEARAAFKWVKRGLYGTVDRNLAARQAANVFRGVSEILTGAAAEKFEAEANQTPPPKRTRKAKLNSQVASGSPARKS